MSPTFSLSATVVGTPDPGGLARFYQRLLGWELFHEEPEWVMIRPPGGRRPGLSFQYESTHAPPAWPQSAGGQQMQLHLDFLVDDLDAASGHALECGARLAELQPQEEVRVFLDPAGHPFCLFAD